MLSFKVRAPERRAGRWNISPARSLEHAISPFPFRMASITASRPSSTLAQRIATLCVEYKAVDIVILDLADVTDMTDYFVILSGTSDTHVRSIAQRLAEDLKKEGSPANHVEGIEQGRWALLDFVDVVVHVFHPTLRTFYQLERLWGDAAVISVAHQGVLP